MGRGWEAALDASTQGKKVWCPRKVLVAAKDGSRAGMQWICKKVRGRPAKLVRSRCGSKVLGTPGSGFHGAAFPLLLKLVSPEAAPWAPQSNACMWHTGSPCPALVSSKADKSPVTLVGILLPGAGVTLTSGRPPWVKVSTPSLTSARCTGPAGLAWL